VKTRFCRKLMGCRVKPGNDEAMSLPSSRGVRNAALDCFAEPVIGRAFARPVGSQMTSL
jgi:hypothetical protein